MDSSQYQFIWVVLALPILGFLVQAFFGKSLERSFGKKFVGALGVLPTAIAFVIAAMLTMKLAGVAPDQRNVVVPGPEWINILGLRLPFEWVVDPLSMTMTLIITGVGALIQFYSTGYMAEDREYSRFFTYMNLFIAAMLVLVLGNNLALLFIGWEGVGLCSYLLIGFWYKDLANARAGNKAFIVNRIGDWSLTLGLFLILVLLATSPHPADPHLFEDGRYLSYDQMLHGLTSVLRGNPGMATAIALLLFGGAAGKSAQFPLYLWLPDAMAGPTPVSALIHAATMVTSGVVLLNRMHIVFECSPVASAIVCAIGAFTAIFAALIAFGQTDIKKVLAYSTVSQLGYMFIGCGAGAYWAGMFHVTTHAFFKALLFLGAGAVIHAMAHNQDMRNYGGLRKYLPITTWTMVIGWFAIAGFPLLSGFWSKDAILGGALANTHAQIEGIQIGQVAGWVGLITAFLTAVYMARLTLLTFGGNEERWRVMPAEAHAADEAHAFVAEDHPAAPTADPYGFYYTDEQVAAAESADHEDHHGLTSEHQPHEVPASMSSVLVILAILSVFAGFVLAHGQAFEKWLTPTQLAVLGDVSVEPNTVPLMLYSSIAAIAGMLLGVFFYWKGLPKNQSFDETGWSPIRRAERDQFGFDSLATTVAVVGGNDVARAVWKWFDDAVIDGIVRGVGWLAAWLGSILRRFQTGYVRLYAMVMLIGVVCFLGYFLVVLSEVGK